MAGLSKMSIFKLAEEFEKLASLAENVESEGDAMSWDELFLSLEGEAEAKVEALAVIKRDSEGCIAALRRRIEDDKAEIARHERRIARMESLALLAVHLVGGRIKTAYAEASSRSSVAAIVVDEAAIPPEYIREKIVREPNKVEALKALKALKLGEAVPGFALETREHGVLK